jgi:formylglycine-generating enzyme required for sulfatase activity
MVIAGDADWRSWGVNQSESSPVVNVSWEDAQAFCRWLTENEGHRYRLPTEAEWEYACRAGSTTPYYTGETLEDLLRAANVADASTSTYFAKMTWAVATDDGWPFTSPVGSFEPNAFGLYDMLGNAAEWCSDWYGETYYSESPAVNPQGPLTGTRKVVRGGAWRNHGKSHSRCSYRYSANPTSAWYDVGFRVVCEPSPN